LGDKENYAGDLTERNSSNDAVMSITDSRPPLEDVTDQILDEYKDLKEKDIQVSYSPVPLFHSQKKGSSPSQYPFAGLKYHNELPPSYQPNRSIGATIRTNTINLFKKKPKIMLDSESPSTPLRVPTHIHCSRLQRRLFPNSFPLEQTILENSKDINPDEPRSKSMDFKSASPDRKLDIPSSPEDNHESRIAYQLRPRPTPKPVTLRYLILGSPRGDEIPMYVPPHRSSRKKKRPDSKKI
jgi:hypothetical protein